MARVGQHGVVVLRHQRAADAADAGDEIEQGAKERREQGDPDPGDGGAHILFGHGGMHGGAGAGDHANRKDDMRPIVARSNCSTWGPWRPGERLAAAGRQRRVRYVGTGCARIKKKICLPGGADALSILCRISFLCCGAVAQLVESRIVDSGCRARIPSATPPEFRLKTVLRRAEVPFFRRWQVPVLVA